MFKKINRNELHLSDQVVLRMTKGYSYTDSELLEAIRKGGRSCDDAMEFLYREYVDQVIAFITQRSGSQEEAKDVFQDAVISLLVSIRQGKFEGKSSLKTYLYAISKNLWYRRFNRSLRSDDYKASNVPDDLDEVTPDEVLMTSNQRRHIGDVLDQLKDKCREVLILWAQKYSMKEIAEQLGYANDQVIRNKKNHCLNELKKLVKDNPQVRNLVQELIR